MHRIVGYVHNLDALTRIRVYPVVQYFAGFWVQVVHDFAVVKTPAIIDAFDVTRPDAVAPE